MSKVDELIARTRELHAAATPGPWEFSHEITETGGVVGTTVGVWSPKAECWLWFDHEKSDAYCADFRAAAEYRTLAPKLADMLERAMKELESLWTASGWCQDGQEAFEEIEAMAEGGEA